MTPRATAAGPPVRGHILCCAKFEPDQPAHYTHTCLLEYGHAGPHHCQLCGADWYAPGVVATS